MSTGYVSRPVFVDPSEFDPWKEDAPFFRAIVEKRQRIQMASDQLAKLGTILCSGDTISPLYMVLHDQPDVVGIIQDFHAKGFDHRNEEQRMAYVTELDQLSTARQLSELVTQS